ncbi:hypothetical protein BDR22DRAFT_823316 [Usnea florida]
MMLSATNSRLPANETQSPDVSPTLHTSSSPNSPLSSQQSSQWGASGIGTVVFGCTASILGILALWMTFWTRQRQPAHADVQEERAELQNSETDATASNDDVTFEYLSGGADAGPEAIGRSRGDAAAVIEA